MRLLYLLLLFTSVLFGAKPASAQQVIASELPKQFTDSNAKYCEWEGLGLNNIPSYLCTCSNLDAAKTTQTNALWNSGSLGINLSGNGLNKLGLWDGGMARTSHIEFTGRIMVMDSPSTLSAHTTAVAGNLMAAGINPNAIGMSSQAQLKNWNFTNDNAEIIAAAPDLFVSNHSYATTAAWTNIGGNWYWYGDTTLHPTRDWKFGYYDNRSRIWDSVMHANPYYLMVKASGNNRGNGIAPGAPHFYWNGSAWALSTTVRDSVGPFDCIPTFGNAKNIICVGAIPVYPNGLVGNINTLDFSSWGPTDDGRIKPDLVGSSGNIISVGSATDSAYAGLGGTSIAAPNITGSLLLLQQYNHQLKGRYMFNATLKALAIHSARRCAVTAMGPDYACGWGIPNFRLAAQTMRDSIRNSIQEVSLLNQDSFETFVYLLPSDTLKCTLVWTDPKGITAAPAYNDTTLKLVNDLDMRVFNLAGSVVAMPFVLNPANPALPATSGDNFRDNVEQIMQTNLPSAWYKVKVKHKGTLQNGSSQRFSLVISGSNTLTALPVTYASLGARQISANEIELNWQTVQEINNKGFEIYHGNTPNNMESIGALAGNGNSNKIHTYKYIFTNHTGFEGTQYFKIKQMDRDGKYSYSTIVSVVPTEPFTIQSVIPNPFENQCIIRYQSPQSAAKLSLYDSQGTLALNLELPADENASIPINTAGMAKGIYLLVLENLASGEKLHLKLIKSE
jgi:hypothetical protein